MLQDHYDDERNKSVFHNTTPDLQVQDRDRFWPESGLVLMTDGLTVSDHVTEINTSKIIHYSVVGGN